MKKIATLTALLTIALGLSPISPAQSAGVEEFVVGTWNTPANGTITVSGNSGFYEGIVSAPFAYGGCTQNVGELIFKILGNGSGSLDGSGITLLGSFQANIPALDCQASTATAEFKLVQSGGVLSFNTCPTWGGDCLNLTKKGQVVDSTKPKIKFQEDKTVTPLNRIIQQLYYVYDNSEKVSVRAQLYSDGKPVWPVGNSWTVYSGDPVLVTFQPSPKETGPFYICVVASDSDGNTTGEFDNCYWRSIEASMDVLANGCGRQLGGKAGTFFQNAVLDRIMYPIGVGKAKEGTSAVEYFYLNVRPACQNHDAGYQGATFKDQITGKYIDSRTKSRAWVDKKFKDDIISICKKYITKKPERGFIDTCIAGPEFKLSDIPAYLAHYKYLGATTYATAVATLAGSGYDSDSTRVGVQSILTRQSLFPGGVRNNQSEPKALYNKKK